MGLGACVCFPSQLQDFSSFFERQTLAFLFFWGGGFSSHFISRKERFSPVSPGALSTGGGTRVRSVHGVRDAKPTVKLSCLTTVITSGSVVGFCLFVCLFFFLETASVARQHMATGSMRLTRPPLLEFNAPRSSRRVIKNASGINEHNISESPFFFPGPFPRSYRLV